MLILVIVLLGVDYGPLDELASILGWATKFWEQYIRWHSSYSSKAGGESLNQMDA